MSSKLDEALKDFKEAAAQSKETKVLALLSIGRLLQERNNIAEAIAAYTEVVAFAPKSEYEKVAKQAIYYLKSPLLAPMREKAYFNK